MKRFQNMKLAAKLILAFSIVLILVVSLGIFSIQQLRKLDKASTDITKKWAPSVSSILKIKYQLTRFRTYELQLALSIDEENYGKYEKSMQSEMSDIRQSMDSYKNLIESQEEQRLYADLQSSLKAYNDAASKVVTLSRSGNMSAARDLIRGDSRKYNFESADLINELVRINEEGSAQAVSFVNNTYVSSRNLIIGLMLTCVVIGAGLALFIANIVTVPLRRAVEAADLVAHGDLTQDIDAHAKDETGQLLSQLNAMSVKLRSVVGQVRAGTDSIAAASKEIAANSQDLSSRTEEQAASLEETAATMQQLTATVKQNAGNTKQVDHLATKTSSAAVNGGKMMQELAVAMQDIKKSSSKISEIIDVINGIAFQTNILALNASVEAARAGTQGRGFAVVATEVRSLAQRSAQAAKEIQVLIDTSARQVEKGASMVERTSATIDEVVDNVHRVSKLIVDINIASAEQTQGIEQISSAMLQMDQVTQKNASLVEEAATAAESLKQQADLLSRTVRQFVLPSDSPEVIEMIPRHLSLRSVSVKALSNHDIAFD